MSLKLTRKGFVRWSPIAECFVVDDRSRTYFLYHSEQKLFARYFYKKGIPKFEVDYYLRVSGPYYYAHILIPQNVFETLC